MENVESVTSHELPPANILILGLPGSGKTTLAEHMIQQDPSITYVSVGQISRDLPADDERRKYVDDLYLNYNKPVGDPEFFVELVRPAIREAKQKGLGIILDGLPKKPEEVEPLNQLLENEGIKIDGVVICDVSPFTALQRVLKRGSREGGLDTIQTAINRGEAYWNAIDNFKDKLGGFLGIRIVNVDTESVDPDSAAKKARQILNEIRVKEASATVIDIPTSEVEIGDTLISELLVCIESNDQKNTLRLLSAILCEEDQKKIINIANLAEEEDKDIDGSIAEYIDYAYEYKNLEKAKMRYARMLRRNIYEPIKNLAYVIPKEVELRNLEGGDKLTHLKTVIREVMVTRQIINAYQSQASTIGNAEEYAAKEFEIRKSDLDHVEGYLREANALQNGVTVRSLMLMQPSYWNIFTSSNLVGSVDGNYQKRINNLPGSHHSLSTPISLPRRMIANSMSEYKPFIEAVSASERSGFDTSLGFLHVVGIDKKGHAFQVEWPLLMHDARLATHPNPLLRDMLSRGQGIYFNHDFWHNMVPVYAESFNLYHPHAPIAYGGLMPNYVNFGLLLRAEKEEYEIFTAMSHARAQQYRMKHDDYYKRSQIGAAKTILSDIPHLKKQLALSDGEAFADNVARYFMTVTVGRLLNIIPPDSPELKPIIQMLDQDQSLNEIVGQEEVLRLLLTQRIVLATRDSRLNFMHDLISEEDISEVIREKIIGYLLPGINSIDKKPAFSGELINEICKQPSIVRLALKYIEPENPFAESGSSALYSSLITIGLDEILEGGSEHAHLNGLNLLRWLAINGPQREPLKGHMEKVHGKDGILFGGEMIPPTELIRRQTEAIMKDRVVYDYRKWAREYSQSLSVDIYNLLLNDNQEEYKDERTTLYILSNYGGVSREEKLVIDKGIRSLDLMLDQLVEANYSFNVNNINQIIKLAEVCDRFSTDLSIAIRNIIKRYEFIKQQENAYQSFASTNYNQAKEAIEVSTMDLLQKFPI